VKRSCIFEPRNFILRHAACHSFLKLYHYLDFTIEGLRQPCLACGDYSMSKRKHIDPLPDEFASYEEAGEFWDTHAITDYPEMIRVVEPDSRSQKRRTTAKKDTTSVAALRETQVKTTGAGVRGKKASRR
jgi:hypothetical protein